MISRVDGMNAHSTGTATTQNKEVQQVVATPVIKEQEKRATSDQPQRELLKEDAQVMIDGMNDLLASADSQLRFVFHDGLNTYYATIVDSVTEEVIREIPPKKLMDIQAAMREFVGLLVDRKI